jgi:hypothetical protein
MNSEALAAISSFFSNEKALKLIKDIARAQHPQTEAQVSKRNAPGPIGARADPLDNDTILSTVFSYVGVGDYFYIAGVCRKWRGLYIGISYKAFPTDKVKLKTTYNSAIISTNRLRLALRCGLTVTALSSNAQRFAAQVVTQSLSPISVLTLAKLHDLQWSCDLCWYAVGYGKLKLLKWLREHGCPWKEKFVLLAAARGNSVLVLKWLSTQTSPWSVELKQQMLWHAGCYRRRATAQWLRKTQQAAWPLSFHGALDFDGAAVKPDCWSAAVVKWALASGCTWGTWSCQQLAPVSYICDCKAGEHAESDNTPTHYTCDRGQAQALFAWAHKNGCPCTCEAAAAAAAVQAQ